MIHKNFVSIEQLVNSYFVARAIDEVRKNKKLSEVMLAGKYEFFEDWLAEVEDKELVELNQKFIEITRFNFKLAAIAKVAIEDMYEFSFINSPSVSSNQKDSDHLRRKFTPNEFDILRKTSLFDHTKHVFKNIVEEMERKEVYNAGGIMLAALIHDFGKSQEIRKKLTPNTTSENSSEYKNHADVSSMYIKDILQEKVRNLLIQQKQDAEVSKTLETISEVVENHHNKASAFAKKIELISMADHKARKEELLSAMS